MDCIKFIAKQLHNMFPTDPATHDADIELLYSVQSEVDRKFRYLASKVIMLSRTGVEPDPFHAMKSPIYLYLISRVMFLQNVVDHHRLKDRIYCLNKSLNGVSIYYKIAMPDVFFLNYASGVVLGDCKYGENLVVYQNVTVGGYRDRVPEVGSNVVIMPNCVISGATKIGNNVVISSGVTCINQMIPDNSLVFGSVNRQSEIKIHKQNNSYIDYFIA